MSNSNPDQVYKHFSVFLLLALGFLIFYIAYSHNSGSGLDFGDDSSELALNQECTDIRFRGPGMGMITDASSSGNDATDCSALFTAGRVFLSSNEATLALNMIEFGDDEGMWPEDGECDDPRFEGEGAVYGGEDLRHDASDCRTLLFQGKVSFNGDPEVRIQDGIDFGDDFGPYSEDGECDDARFSGPGMATLEGLEASSLGHDASDCFGLYNDGRVVLETMQFIDGIDFGDDTGNSADDGKCDDPRFMGEGAAASSQQGDALHDASDCRSLYRSNAVTYIGDSSGGIMQTGSLAASDDEIEPGKFVDVYSFTGSANQRAVFDLRADDFDTYLIVVSPSGEETENDDFNGDFNRSLLSMILPEDGTYQVWVTSYAEGATGTYTLNVVGEGITSVTP